MDNFSNVSISGSFKSPLSPRSLVALHFVTVLVGMAAGGILYFTKDTKVLNEMKLLHGNFIGLFMIFLLPAIIFEAGYNMHKVFY